MMKYNILLNTYYTLTFEINSKIQQAKKNNIQKVTKSVLYSYIEGFQ